MMIRLTIIGLIGICVIVFFAYFVKELFAKRDIAKNLLKQTMRELRKGEFFSADNTTTSVKAMLLAMVLAPAFMLLIDFDNFFLEHVGVFVVSFSIFYVVLGSVTILESCWEYTQEHLQEEC